MPVFISYSRSDKDFATELAMQLIKHKAHIWIDQWELHVGDSLIDKIQGAIQGASGLLVLLSKASVESEWCKKELNAGLIRELEEKRVVVLPVLVEDCQIPLFLREKVYADFRTDFDVGLNAVLESIARVTSDSLSRVETPEWLVDWSIDYDVHEAEGYCLLITAVDRPVNQPYSVLIQIHVTGNDTANQRYSALRDSGLDWVEHEAILHFLHKVAAEQNLRIFLEDAREKVISLGLTDTHSPAIFDVKITTRRLGQDTGRDILFDVGKQLKELIDSFDGKRRRPTPTELARLRAIHERFETKNR